MGTFLSLAGIAGATLSEVTAALAKQARAQNRSLAAAPGASHEDSGVFLVHEGNPQRVSVLFPRDCVEWDAISQELSRDLHAPVFSFHIHDGDLWMYRFFVAGEQRDAFNPITDYWDPAEPLDPWAGNAEVLAANWLGVGAAVLTPYLVRWEPEAEDEGLRAHPDDEFDQQDWQLVDFMLRLGLAYPIDGQGRPLGRALRWAPWGVNLPVRQFAAATGIAKSQVGRVLLVVPSLTAGQEEGADEESSPRHARLTHVAVADISVAR